MKIPRAYRGGNPFLFICFLVAAAIIGALMLEKYVERHEAAVPPAQVAPGGSLPVTLFFSSPDGDYLVGETRRIEQCPDLDDCVAEVVEELVNGPLGELGPTLPPASVLLRVSVDGDTAVIDFGGSFRDGLPSGSSAEMMAVYSVADTVAKNFPNLRRVRFLLDGQPVDTLKGHLDLRQPIEPDFSLVRGTSTGR